MIRWLRFITLVVVTAMGTSSAVAQTAPAPEGESPPPAAEVPRAPSLPPLPPPSAEGGIQDTSVGVATASSTAELEDEPAKGQSKWHGSTLSFDQSVTTQTVHLGGDYQTYNPTYEWWIAFKPRYYIYESKTTAVSANFWANLYLELTDSDTTTRKREPILGPSYLWALFARSFNVRGGYKTTLSIGPRAAIPTDKAARNVGQFVGLGGMAGASQAFPLRGRRARWLTEGRLGVNVIYNHVFSQATSGTSGDLQQLRQDVLGQTFTSDQLSGKMLTRNSLNVAITGAVQILPRLDLSLSYVWLNAWTSPPPATCVQAFPQCVMLPQDDPVTYAVATWALAAVNYDVTDDFSVEAGYYNLTGQIGPDGTRRNPLWSPHARLFVTLIGKLDGLYARFAGKRP